MVTNSYSHVLPVSKTWFAGTVTGKDVEILQNLNDDLTRCKWRKNLTQEVIGLRRHDAEEGYLAQLLFEVSTLGNKTGAGFLVVALVFGVDLHVELSKGVKVPDGNALLHLGYEGPIRRG